MGRVGDFTSMLAERRCGFHMDEVMTGTHQFEPEFGPPGEKFMEFRATWGPKHLTEFANPFGGKFMYTDLCGYVDIEGLCANVPMSGSLELLYFTEQKLRYTFEFEVDGKEYLFVGEKRDLRPWNLHRTHATLYGTLTEKLSGRVVSRSITYFRFKTAPKFMLSFRFA
jgi:hypothetical protein